MSTKMPSSEKVGGNKSQQAGGNPLTNMLGLDANASATGGRRRRRTSKGSRRKRSSKSRRRR